MIEHDQWLTDNGYRIRECGKCQTSYAALNEANWLSPVCPDCRAKAVRWDNILNFIFKIWLSFFFFLLITTATITNMDSIYNRLVRTISNINIDRHWY